MVNGNYSVYGDRPSSETEYVDDHVRSPVAADRKPKRTNNRTANELQSSLNRANQLDNETDSIKYEKKVKEPRLLRYVPTTDVEENFVAEKFETYDMKPGTEERPRRHGFTKKARNPSDGSVNYGYSRSSSSSPNANLPTISEHSEQYSTYRIKPNTDLKTNFENKFDKYFIKTNDNKRKYDGTHPDSLYRVGGAGAGGGGVADAGGGRAARALRALRWPAALIVVCAALGVFVYFLMPSNTGAHDNVNSTVWETEVSSAVSAAPQQHPKTVVSSTEMREFTTRPTNTPRSTTTRQPSTTVQRTTKKPIEIDFYHPEKISDVLSIIDSISGDQKRLVPPVYPDHITPEVQYGDKDKGRTPKLFDDKNKLPEDSTLKPHITQKPEKPLAVFLNHAVAAAAPESLNRAESGPTSDLKFLEKLLKSSTEETQKPQLTLEDLLEPEHGTEKVTKQISEASLNFTSGHSKIFGVGIEDVDKMRSTTQSSAYNTRVSPTLPTWRNNPDSTTKNYPVNNTDVSHCHSPRVRYCRGALPYDLAGPSIKMKGLSFDLILRKMDMLYNANCSSRIRHFVCSLLEPECQPVGIPPKKPCFNLCRTIRGLCYHVFPNLLTHFLNCEDGYSNTDCFEASQPCYADEIPCQDGTCVHRATICDGVKDCPTGVDEEGCGACLNTQYRCPSTGECITKSWMCDGVNDCANAEDESNDECKRNGVPNFEEPKSFEYENEKYGTDEPGGQGAGSSPVKTFTAYGRPSNRKHKTDESSKELLETSDTSNALKRNYTRRPTPAQFRLSPYKLRPMLERTLPPVPLEDLSRETTSQPETRKLSRKKTPKPDARREDEENVGLLDSYEKRDVDKNRLIEQSRPKVQKVFRPEKNSSSDYFERHIDPKAVMEAQRKEEEAERQKKLRNPPEEMVIDKEDAALAGRSSPCPAGELRCVDGRCITLAMLCDGQIDCSDHADEDNCFT